MVRLTKILYATSSIGLGHVTRDYHIKKFLNHDVIWLTSGNALNYLKIKNEKIETISYELKNLGSYLGDKIIRNCEVKINPLNSYSFYKAVKFNSEKIKEGIDFDSYDLIVADEFWEFLLLDRLPKEKSIFITDFTRITYNKMGFFEKYVIPKLNNGLRERLNKKFSLRINLSLWDRDKDYINLGPSFTHDFNEKNGRNGDSSKNEYILINIGGTDAAKNMAEKIKERLEKNKVETIIIGSSKYFNKNPFKLMEKSEAIITLSGYGGIVETNILNKPAIFLYIDNHFEHLENAKLMENRKGYRVFSCKDLLRIDLLKTLNEITKENTEPLKLNDSAIEISKIIDNFNSRY
ncbi:MAG: glycosyltransferase [Caldisphaera sp.]|nr:glycosyltransferase [Caldisphaera sp.]